jgi:hypothetical protein
MVESCCYKSVAIVLKLCRKKSEDFKITVSICQVVSGAICGMKCSVEHVSFAPA